MRWHGTSLRPRTWFKCLRRDPAVRHLPSCSHCGAAAPEHSGPGNPPAGASFEKAYARPENGDEMKPLPHLYEVALSAGQTAYATLSAGGVPPLRSAPPKDFDGPGDAWSPEHLLLAAVETCFMFTFRAVALASKFDFLSLDLLGRGTVDRKDGVTRFTEIALDTRLTLPKGADPERAKRMLEKGKNACLVTASLSVPVLLEAEIVVAS